MSPHGRVVNFGAGPSALPLPVLEQAAPALLNFAATGVGIAEISHRSPEFMAFLATVEASIRTQLGVPSTHAVLFTQGGGSAQFAAVVLNMLARYTLLHPDRRGADAVLDYVVTGSWSAKAAEEARRLTLGGRATNETVDGVEFAHAADSPAAFPFALLDAAAAGAGALLPLVADYSSSFMCRPIPRLADHAVIYAGAQKNIGPAGLTVLIVRQDCLVDVDAAAQLGALPVPTMFSWKTLADAKSLYNTPSVLSIYITGLVLARMEAQGGVHYYEELNRKKALKVYNAIREGQEKGVFKKKVKNGSESWMNAVFEVLAEGAEKRFLDGAKEQGMTGLKGHRSVGGIRVSLYNAVTEEQVDKLVQFMNDFITKETEDKEA
ncbi:hypothetical protein PHLGIDRAFT_126161 [Phlebiopsis gigantea 11061_1 CR5-6]|uniref:phosphoserine transaminase n=1 Tax=Phlebiopsis gigantea (strain 11061_1 CR5-6) TaxID=745531 RepID=A0A0C3S2L0_PHLG1|nr:hypothetical protein PHLGIDRAFT_126161 [Phlebiopsis gigantea 11061_1 CR5-6]